MPAADEAEQLPFEELLGADARARVEDVKAGLQAILAMLSESSNGDALPKSRVKDDAASAGSVRRPMRRRRRVRGRRLERAGSGVGRRRSKLARERADGRILGGCRPSVSEQIACVGMWRSLVAHLTGGQGVAGSNPVIPTN